MYTPVPFSYFLFYSPSGETRDKGVYLSPLDLRERFIHAVNEFANASVSVSILETEESFDILYTYNDI